MRQKPSARMIIAMNVVLFRGRTLTSNSGAAVVANSAITANVFLRDEPFSLAVCAIAAGLADTGPPPASYRLHVFFESRGRVRESDSRLPVGACRIYAPCPAR